MTGLSKYEICRLRNDTRNGKLSTIKKIAEVLDVPVSLLVRKEKNMAILIFKGKAKDFSSEKWKKIEPTKSHQATR